MMFKNLFLIIAILPFSIFSQEVTDSVKINRILDQVNVNALRANKTTPVAFTNITKEELDQANKQFSDLLKGLGLAGVFALPGGLLAIAFMVKLGEKLGIDIIPEKYKK